MNKATQFTTTFNAIQDDMKKNVLAMLNHIARGGKVHVVEQHYNNDEIHFHHSELANHYSMFSYVNVGEDISILDTETHPVQDNWVCFPVLMDLIGEYSDARFSIEVERNKIYDLKGRGHINFEYNKVASLVTCLELDVLPDTIKKAAAMGLDTSLFA